MSERDQKIAATGYAIVVGFGSIAFWTGRNWPWFVAWALLVAVFIFEAKMRTRDTD